MQSLLKDPRTNWKFIFIVVILGFLAGAGILGYYYLWLKDLETELAETETRLPEIKRPEKLAEDETINWKIYINPSFGFSIKYPPEWFVYDNKTPPCVGEIPEFVFINQAPLKDCGAMPDLIADFYIFVINEPFLPLPQSTQYDAYTPFEISGEEGVINFRTEESEGPRRIDTRIYVNHNNRSYQISYPNTDYRGSHDPIYEQILSTFKFIE